MAPLSPPTNTSAAMLVFAVLENSGCKGELVWLYDSWFKR
jgi:hypothetical protein